jgi:hypothetical protein
MSGDKRWAPDEELLKEYDFEFEYAAGQKYFNDTVGEAAADVENNRGKIIGFSNMHRSPGVKVFS